MNDKTVELINRLADKFGTTAEHLWGVLLKQAFISANVSLLASIAILGFIVFSFFFVRRKTKQPPRDERGWQESAEWNDPALAWIVWTIVTLILFAALCFNISDFITAFFNPEYWALNQILPQ